MKNKAKLLATLLFTLIVSGIGYSKVATAASCLILSGRMYCY